MNDSPFSLFSLLVARYELNAGKDVTSKIKNTSMAVKYFLCSTTPVFYREPYLTFLPISLLWLLVFLAWLLMFFGSMKRFV